MLQTEPLQTEPPKPHGQSGFTLLEVMIAMAIMLVGFASILMVQSSSLNTAIRARQMNIVSSLMKQIMIDTEYALEGKQFTEIDKEKTGTFDEPFKDYTWKREIKEVKFPNIASIAQSAQGAGGTQTSASQAGVNQQGGGDPTQMVGKLVTAFLSKAIREVQVTITWKSGSGNRNVRVSTYWVNLNQEFSLSE